MAAYGRGFTLASEAGHDLYDPAVGGCDPGIYTATAGYWGYNEYCERMFGTDSEPGGEFDQWTIVSG